MCTLACALTRDQSLLNFFLVANQVCISTGLVTVGFLRLNSPFLFVDVLEVRHKCSESRGALVRCDGLGRYVNFVIDNEVEPHSLALGILRALTCIGQLCL